MRTLPLLLLLACPKNPSDSDPESDTDTDVDTDEPGLTGEDGSLALLREYDEGAPESAEVVGVFVANDQGFLNAAQCLTGPAAPCVRELPTTIDASIPWDPSDRFDPDFAQYRYVGLSVRFGPFRTFYEVTEDFSWYTADVLGEEPDGPLGVELDVQWGAFQGDDLTVAADPLVLTSPSGPDVQRVFSDRTDWPLRWEPGSEGQLYLFVRDLDEPTVGWIHLLEDDGAFDFDVSALELDGSRNLVFELARWTLATVDVNGNDLQLQTSASSRFAVRYLDVSDRVPITPVDTCESGAPELADGRYYGDLSGEQDDYQEVACLESFDGADGRDAVFTLTVQPYEELEVVYRQLAANAVMYLYEDCAAEPPVCVEGEDADPGQGAEVLRMFNPHPTDPLVRALVLDASDPLTGDVYFLDVTRTVIPDPELGDTCLDALTAAALQPGRYWVADPSALASDLDPGFTGCTDAGAPGPDGLFPVEIPAGATLDVTVQMPGADPSIYLLSQCNDLDSCLVGENDGVGGNESLVYTNASAAAERLVVVVDTRDVIEPFFLTVGIQ